jgi:mono/diheme cytochrome c family protein
MREHPEVRLGPVAAVTIIASVLMLAACDRAGPQTITSDPASRSTAEAQLGIHASTAAEIERGRTLAVLGNCAGCHTARGGAAYAGGPALRTPFGVAYGGNLTPDDATGIGRWTRDDFWRALHLGLGRDGRALVPAFPYTAFTHILRADSDALHAYLHSLPPVYQPSPPQALRFPYGTALALQAWQWFNFTPADVDAEAKARQRLNPGQARGAYLVQGLGHCAACHAPRNAFGAASPDPTGSLMPMQDWYAPSLHPVAGQPVDTEEVVAMLKVGQTARGAVLGPMSVVVFQSTQHWPEPDLQAVGAYLATLPAQAQPGATEAAPSATLGTGRLLYSDHCADCHGKQGEGVPGAYPALAGNATVLQPTPVNLVKVMRHGGFAPSTAGQPRPYGMPPQRLSDAQTAAVLSYVRQSWGHQASAVTELDVLKLH